MRADVQTAPIMRPATALRACSNVLVTGGTRGLGKAIGLEFARTGATVFLTHRWGSVEEGDLADEFGSAGLRPPHVFESDASDPQSTRALMNRIKDEVGTLDAVVSNVAFAKAVHDIGDLKKASLDLSLSYSAWPVVDLVQATGEVLGRYPRYVVAISSDGGEVCHDAYDLAGVAKSALETLCRYLAIRLRPEGVRVNAIRPGVLDTVSARQTFGDEVVDRLHERTDGFLLDLQSVARVAVALCSGLLDSVTGQVITVDEGWSLVSPIAYITGRGIPGAFPHDDGAG